MQPLQSAYRQVHSTETALTFVANDVLCALNKKKSVFLVLVDLLAAFDTVKHSILLQCLANRIGLGGTPLWLVNRWWEVLAPGLSQWHAAGLGPGPNILHHLYASHWRYRPQVQYVLPPVHGWYPIIYDLWQQCPHFKRSWMHLNKLTLNSDKTKFLHFSPCSFDLMEAMKIGSDIISAGMEAKNIGLIFDSDFTLNDHVTAVCKSANYQLYKISH